MPVGGRGGKVGGIQSYGVRNGKGRAKHLRDQRGDRVDVHRVGCDDRYPDHDGTVLPATRELQEATRARVARVTQAPASPTGVLHHRLASGQGLRPAGSPEPRESAEPSCNVSTLKSLDHSYNLKKQRS
ncbi:hypothetical protein J6590_047289 [Homalodisca vitripennis]|nr:hypothetical protein J6590_047289 [Homalodisca vitripennis]